MDAEVVGYIYNRTLFSLEKEGNPAICNNTDELWGHYAKLDKSDRERQKSQTYKNREYSGLGGVGGGAVGEMLLKVQARNQ